MISSISIGIMILITIFLLVISFMVSAIMREIIEIFYNTSNYLMLIITVPIFIVLMLILMPKMWVYLF